ncbi:MAG: VanW family protein [Armatimonadota bacterium]
MTDFSDSGHTPSPGSARKRSRALIGTLICLGLVLAALGAGSYFLLPHNDRMLTGVSVNGKALGGQTRAEAQAAVEASLARETERQVTLTAASEQRAITLAALGIRPDVDGTIDRAYGVGRQGSIFSRLAQAMQARRDSVPVPPAYTLDQDAVKRTLVDIAHVIDRPSTNATAKWDAGAKKVVIDPGITGGKLNIDQSLELITVSTVGKLATGEAVPEELALPYDANQPRVTAEMLAPVDTLLSTFTTSYGTSSRNRAINVETAAASINGTILMPGEEFSYNKVVGPRDAQNGFRIAPVIVNGQLEPGMGGGVCQVSTTAYNAALLANLKITARSHHSHPVAYVPSGRDATVVYGVIDLKFRNSTDAPIVIETQTGGRRLTVRILGKGPAPVVSIERSGISRLGGRSITKKDPKLPAGTRVVEQRGGGGLAVTVTRVVGEGDDAVREVVSRDRYIGEPRVVRVGTGARAANASGSATTSSMAGGE